MPDLASPKWCRDGRWIDGQLLNHRGKVIHSNRIATASVAPPEQINHSIPTLEEWMRQMASRAIVGETTAEGW